MASMLLVNLYFPPDRSATAQIFNDLAQAITAAEHRLTVLCGRPSYRPDRRQSWLPLRRERLSADLTVERVGSTALEMNSLRGRAANYLSFLMLAGLRVALRRRADLVIAGSDPPLAILVALLAGRGRPVVYHLQDLHPEAALAAGWLREGWIADTWDRVHRAALSRCALVVCLGRDMAARLEAKGVSRDRIEVVPNGAPRPEGRPDAGLVSRLRAGNDFVVVHAGNLGVAGAWESIASAAEQVGSAADIVCVGAGAREEQVRAWSLRVEPFQTDVASVMAAGDVQLVTQRTEMEGLLVPSKLYTAVAYGRPVLAVVPPGSEVAATVREWECGVVADPDDPDDIAAKILDLRGKDDVLARMSERARAAGRHFERRTLFEALVRTLERQLRVES